MVLRVTRLLLDRGGVYRNHHHHSLSNRPGYDREYQNPAAAALQPDPAASMLLRAHSLSLSDVSAARSLPRHPPPRRERIVWRCGEPSSASDDHDPSSTSSRTSGWASGMGLSVAEQFDRAYHTRTIRGLRTDDVTFDRPRLTRESTRYREKGTRIFLGMEAALANPHADILVIGDYGLSFSAELARVRVAGGVQRIIATTPNAPDEHAHHHDDADHNHRTLLVRNVAVMFSILPHSLHTHPILSTLRFDFIIWPFPSTNCSIRLPLTSSHTPRLGPSRTDPPRYVDRDGGFQPFFYRDRHSYLEHRTSRSPSLANVPSGFGSWRGDGPADAMFAAAASAGGWGEAGMRLRTGGGGGGSESRSGTGQGSGVGGWEEDAGAEFRSARRAAARRLELPRVVGGDVNGEVDVAEAVDDPAVAMEARERRRDMVLGAAHIYAGMMSASPLLKPCGELVVPHCTYTDGSSFDLSRATRAAGRYFALASEPYPQFWNEVIPSLFVPHVQDTAADATVHRFALKKEFVVPYDVELNNAARTAARPELVVIERKPPRWLARNPDASPLPTRAGAALQHVRYLPAAVDTAAKRGGITQYVQQLRLQRAERGLDTDVGLRVIGAS